MEALDRGDYAEVRSRIKYLTQRHEQMVKSYDDAVETANRQNVGN